MSQVTRGPRTLSARGKPYDRMCAQGSPTFRHRRILCMFHIRTDIGIGLVVLCIAWLLRLAKPAMIIPGYQSRIKANQSVPGLLT